MAKLPYPTVEATGAMVRAGDKDAIAFIAERLIEAGGDSGKVAAAMGVSLRVLYKWRAASPALDRVFQRHGKGPGQPKKDA